jgi:transposase-like protein
MSKTRKRYSSQEKTSILREHLINKVPVSDLCDQHGIHPTLFYQWQKNMFENMPLIFESKRGTEVSRLRRQNDELKAKLSHKDMVIAEIMEEYVAIKKNSLGDH